MKRASIKDVAQRAGVSIATVSNALSGKGTMKEETRAHVLEIARQLLYFPNCNGSGLKMNRQKCIVFYTDTLYGYYCDLANSIKNACDAYNYELEILFGEENDRLMRNLLSNRVDGAVIINQAFTEKLAATAEHYAIPIAYMDRVRTGKYSASVLLDSYHAGATAAQYLYDLGHRSFMIIKGRDNYNGNQRFEGFIDFMSRHDITVSDEYCLCGNFRREVAYSAMKDFFKTELKLPDAIFATNDDSAFSCVNALKEAGYNVPRDVSLIGCDDVELCQWFIPALTTINPDAGKQGYLAATQLFNMISGAPGCSQKVRGHLVERASCAERRS